MNAQYGHARNCHPAPPITIEVEQGVITSFQIKKEAIGKYTGGEISTLFEAAGVGPARINMPFPEAYKHVPLGLIRFSLRPGTHLVEHIGDTLLLPESAFDYSVAKEP